MTEKQGWIGDPQVKDIRTTKAESETRLTKLQEKYPILGYGITKSSPEKISVLVEEITPDIESLFRSGIRGYDTKIIEIGHIVALSVDRTDEYRPLVGGISTGHFLVSAGTLGSIVYDSNTSKPLLLSNAHVLANSDTPTEDLALTGDDIFQPGKYDTGTEVVASLYNWIPLQDGVTVDAALAAPLIDVSNTIIDIPRITGIASPQVGMKVKKSGRTTGFTEGEIMSVESTIDVDYGTETIRLTDQFITTCMSAGGDSGSICINDNNDVIGLLFAGSDKVTVFNKIENVINQLNIKFVPYDTAEDYEEVIPPAQWPSQTDAILIALAVAALAITYSCMK